MIKEAVISQCGNYRYSLTRIWDEGLSICNFIMLNPSTANAQTDDPTIRKVVAYAKKWGFGGIMVTNLFAIRSSNRSRILYTADPIGPENDNYISTTARSYDPVICAWGTYGCYKNRSKVVINMLQNVGVKLYKIELCKNGEPGHLLFLPLNLKYSIIQSK